MVTSQFEKLVEALNMLRKYQPAARLHIRGNYFLVGDTTDTYLPDGLKRKLKDYGFRVEESLGMFAFEIPEERS